MQFIKCSETDRGYVLDSESYPAYLETIRDRLPAQARSFAEAEWHYDFKDFKCPHDSWVEKVTITEPADGETKSDRGLQIKVTLLGAYHDGLIELCYVGVYSYEMRGRQDATGPRLRRPHGDWLIDEIRLSETGQVIHEIRFERATWLIVCEDLSYKWIQGKPY
jgi:hypothetical protein